jgi:hypothetical protein
MHGSTCPAQKGPGERIRSQPMIRNLKALVLAVGAVGVLGALGATAAQAVPTFTTVGGGNATLKVLPDGVVPGKTSHQVFDIRRADGTGSLPIACEKPTGEGTVSGESYTDITTKTSKFNGCTFLGQAVTVTNTGCDFTFTADGTLHIIDETPLECEHGKKAVHYQTAAPLECRVEVGKQTVTGIKYHNLDSTGKTVGSNEGEMVTVEAKEIVVEYQATGKDCPYGTTKNGLFTTGSAILTGQEDPGSAMLKVRWDA